MSQTKEVLTVEDVMQDFELLEEVTGHKPPIKTALQQTAFIVRIDKKLIQSNVVKTSPTPFHFQSSWAQNKNEGISQIFSILNADYPETVEFVPRVSNDIKIDTIDNESSLCHIYRVCAGVVRNLCTTKINAFVCCASKTQHAL